jgi:hypothetical protein
LKVIGWIRKIRHIPEGIARIGLKPRILQQLASGRIGCDRELSMLRNLFSSERTHLSQDRRVIIILNGHVRNPELS